MKFLSDEWVAALAEAAHAIPPGTFTGIDVCVQYVVVGDEPVRYWVRVHEGVVTTGMGTASNPDVVITSDRESAAALAQSEASAQELFRAGRLRLHGDVSKLIAWSEALRAAGDPFGTLRSLSAM